MDSSLKTQELEVVLLNNCLQCKDAADLPSIAKKIATGLYYEVLTGKFVLSTIKYLKNLEKDVTDSVESNPREQLNWLSVGVASLLHFIQINWTGPETIEDVDYLLGHREIALQKLSYNDGCNENLRGPEFLYLSKIIFKALDAVGQLESSTWWYFRAIHLHQIILDESSADLFDESELLISKIMKLDLLKDEYLNVTFNLEATQFYYLHRRVQSSEKNLDNALNVSKLNLELQGALGKRTRYQKDEKAQLFLNVKLEKEPFPFDKHNDLPKSLELNDDLRLEKIKFTETHETSKTGAVEQATIMSKFFQLLLYQPKDKLTDEEITPYLNTVIEDCENWCVRVSSLYQRCILESNHKRTIDRALSQCEYLIEQLNHSNPPISSRMDLFFASGIKPQWKLKQTLADMMLNLGLVKGALELYLKLHLWEEVIVCYTILDLKHKAAGIIRQEVNKKPTVKLWCLLGDATQDTAHYETAWKLSNEKSSRAQRHWGLYYYSKQDYTNAIPHLKVSVELNGLQENVWSRLGFSALQVEDWKLAAMAYRRYCALEQSSFEAWNNLAKAYIKLGDKPRAWRSLHDAVKCNYDCWEVWDNLMVVSVDIGHFSDVIMSYHRILDLKGQHIDVQILEILTQAIIQDKPDANEQPSRKFLQDALKLFGHLTSLVPNNADVWRMYGELTALKETDIDKQKAAQYLQRAHQAATANVTWVQTQESAKRVLELCHLLAHAYLASSKNCSLKQQRSMLGSAKLSLNGVVKRVKDQQWLDQLVISESLQKVENDLEQIIRELNVVIAAVE